MLVYLQVSRAHLFGFMANDASMQVTEGNEEEMHLSSLEDPCPL